MCLNLGLSQWIEQCSVKTSHINFIILKIIFVFELLQVVFVKLIKITDLF